MKLGFTALLRVAKILWWYSTRGRLNGTVRSGLNSMYRRGLLSSKWIQSKEGFWMYLNPTDIVQRTIWITGEWGSQQTQWLKQNLSADETYIDIGANVGYFALLAAQLVGPSGKVIAVEPDPVTADVLQRNATRNLFSFPIERCACVQHSSSDAVAFFRDRDSGESSLVGRGSRNETSIIASAKTVDQLVREHNLERIDVIKIDVEGAEYMVIEGAHETLRRFRPKLLIEIDAENLARFGRAPRDLKNLLNQIGYTSGHVLKEPDYVFASSICGSLIRSNDPRSHAPQAQQR